LWSGCAIQTVSQNGAGPNKKHYDEEIRKFAFTLHFYSPRVYKYVRSVFRLALPHPSVIRYWCHPVNGEAGFTQESFSILKLHVKCATQKGNRVICNLIMDKMAIRKHTEYAET